MMMNQSPDIQNPYPFYQKIQKTNPIFENSEHTWYLTKHVDVKNLLSNHKIFSRVPPIENGYIHSNMSNKQIEEILSIWPIFNDPPNHTEIRKKLSFLMRRDILSDAEKKIEEIAENLLQNLLIQKNADFMEGFATPLPVQVVNHLFGADLSIAQVREWSLVLSGSLDKGSPEDFEKLIPTVLQMQAYFKKLIDSYLDKTNSAQNNWMTCLIEAYTEDNIIHYKEIINLSIFLILAGHETVQLSLGLGLRTLLNHPNELTLLVENPKLLHTTIEEMLRFESPTNKISRWTKEDVWIGNQFIPKDQLVVGLMNAANRDPSQFFEAEKFNILRKDNQHLAFGVGIHSCIGALLARLELRIAFGKLLPYLHRFSVNIKQKEEWLPNSSFRYLSKIFIKIDD